MIEAVSKPILSYTLGGEQSGERRRRDGSGLEKPPWGSTSV